MGGHNATDGHHAMDDAPPSRGPRGPLVPWDPWAASHGRHLGPLGPWAPWAASHGWAPWAASHGRHLGPWAPWAASHGRHLGPLGPWAPNPLLWVADKFETLPENRLWGILGSKISEKKLGFGSQDPHGEIRAGILSQIPVLKS